MNKDFKSTLINSIIVLILVSTFFGYYPKYEKQNTEATISWDVAGYYFYLPAIFIYNDLKQCKFANHIIEKYRPAPRFDSAFKDKKSGNYILKYPIGQAIQFCPSFLIAHTWAKNSKQYPADGFSFPYQFLVALNSLLIALLGFYFCSKILLVYFNKFVVALSFLLILIGSNYLNYAVIDGAMTHNNLFTIYTILIFTSIKFYKKPNLTKAILIGFLVGLASITRPTEIISFLIPLLWGLNVFDKSEIVKRINFFKTNNTLIFISILTCILVGFIQLFYWYYVSGNWFVYSYQEQGFSWLKPHFINGIFGYRSGWLTYSPLMVFSIIGFYFLFKYDKKLFFPVLIFSSLFIYITFAWDIFWYGGSIGVRAMVQCYPILIFPFAAFINWLISQKIIIKAFFALLVFTFCYLSLWFTHQAHLGGILKVGQMNRTYYWTTLGTWKKNTNHLKILDTNEFFKGKRKNVKVIYENNFEEIESNFCLLKNKTKAICLNNKNQNSNKFFVEFNNQKFKWLRAIADFKIFEKEYDIQKQTQFIVKFLNNKKVVKTKKFRVHRVLKNNDDKEIYFDIKKPKENFNQIEVSFSNANSNKKITIDNLKLETFF